MHDKTFGVNCGVKHLDKAHEVLREFWKNYSPTQLAHKVPKYICHKINIHKQPLNNEQQSVH